MIVANVRKNEPIRIGDDIRVTVVRNGRDVVRLQIDAPRDVPINWKRPEPPGDNEQGTPCRAALILIACVLTLPAAPAVAHTDRARPDAERCRVIEFNEYTGLGFGALSQVIVWDEYPDGCLHVVTYYAQRTTRRPIWNGKHYVLHLGGHRFVSDDWIETRTVEDPEVDDRERWPVDRRRGVLPPERLHLISGQREGPR